MQISEKIYSQRSIVPVLIVLVIALSCINIIVVLNAAYPELPIGADSYAYLAAGQALIDGTDPWAAELFVRTPAIVQVPIYRYPPVLAILFIPFGYLPFTIALWTWLIVVGCTTIALGWSLRPLVGARVAMIGVFAFLPTWQSLYMGQINAAVATLTVAAILSLTQSNNMRVGFYLALGTLLKFAPGLTLVLFFMRRSWYVLAGAIITVALCIVVSLAFTPTSAWLNSITAMLQSTPNPLFVSLPAYIHRYAGSHSHLVSLFVVCSIVLTTLIRGRTIPFRLAIAATIIVPMLVTMTVWQYSTVLVLPALAILWAYSIRGKLLASYAWLSLSLLGGFAIPLALSVCWVFTCFPRLLEDTQEEKSVWSSP